MSVFNIARTVILGTSVAVDDARFRFGLTRDHCVLQPFVSFSHLLYLGMPFNAYLNAVKCLIAVL